MPTQPSQFAMILRKHLNNSRLISVEQRLIVIELSFEHGRGLQSERNVQGWKRLALDEEES